MKSRLFMHCVAKARVLLMILAVTAATCVGLRAQAEDEDTYMGENPARYAQVKVVEGDVQIQKGDTQEALDRGTPVAEGDVVESHGRGILQLGDGTRLAFGPETRFRVAELFMEESAQSQVLIRLDYGRLRVSLGPDSEARFRVDTPSGSGVLVDRSSASFEAAAERVTRVRVHTGRLTFSNEINRAIIRAGERLTVYSSQDQLDRVRSFNTYDSDEFDSWCDRYLSVKHGESYAHVPAEIRYYSDELDGSGDWTYVDDCASWCWRPRGLEADWRPYWNGRWGCYPGGMTWVSYEPWGYLTHHYGRWGWRGGFGWYWIPGVYFAPAWVAWQTEDAYFGWAPLGWHNEPCSWGHNSWGGGHCWNVVQVNFINDRHIHNHIYGDPIVLRRFNPGPGAPTWPGSPGRRPLTPPWRQGPLMVNQREFRNPVLIRPLVEDRNLHQQRFHEYERQAQATGRTIYRRDPAMPSRPLAPGGSQAPVSGTITRAPFEDRSRLRPMGRVPMSASPAASGSAPVRSQERPTAPPSRQDTEDRTNRTPSRPAENIGTPSRGDRPTYVDQTPHRERPRVEERPQAPRDEPRRDFPREERRAPERSREDRPVERHLDRSPERPAPAPARPVERPAAPPPAARPVEHPSAPTRSEAPRSEPSRSHEADKKK